MGGQILDLLVLKSVRARATVELFSYVLFMFAYFFALVLQRSQTDAYALESALQDRLLEVRSDHPESQIASHARVVPS